MFLGVFMSNLDENGSNLFPSGHSVLITCSGLLKEKSSSFNRMKDYRSDFKED